MISTTRINYDATGSPAAVVDMRRRTHTHTHTHIDLCCTGARPLASAKQETRVGEERKAEDSLVPVDVFFFGAKGRLTLLLAPAVLRLAEMSYIGRPERKGRRSEKVRERAREGSKAIRLLHLSHQGGRQTHTHSHPPTYTHTLPPTHTHLAVLASESSGNPRFSSADAAVDQRGVSLAAAALFRRRASPSLALLNSCT